MRINIGVPLLSIDPLGKRETKSARTQRIAHETETVLHMLRASSYEPPPLPVVVTMERAALDTLALDRLVVALDGVRDAIAQWLGVSETNASEVVWQYKQHATDNFGVSINIEEQP